MGYSLDSLTNDCYDGTCCLINKFGITDEKQLSEVESRITFAKASELERNPICGNFDFEHYKSIHRFLFEDIYEWAGRVRNIDMSKKGTVFVRADEILNIADACFTRLRDADFFRGLCKNEYVDNIVDFYCVTNRLHPFREGNGRTQRIFITQLIRYSGYDIDLYNIDTDRLMIATIHSANGVNSFLKEIFSEAII